MRRPVAKAAGRFCYVNLAVMSLGQPFQFFIQKQLYASRAESFHFAKHPHFLKFAPEMMCDELVFPFLEQTLTLLCQKAIYWKEEKALIAADVHLGKGGHFRKAGIAVPRDLAQEDLAVLSDLIHQHKPEKIIFLGDLFHSDMNTDWEWFALWREQFPKLEIILIRGNHDVIHDKHYHKLNVTLHKELLMGPFLMLHHPLPPAKLEQAQGYVLCGHIHPGVNLRGRGRQSITLPCFAFSDKQAILPSFGKFTGRVAIQHQQTDKVFGVLPDKIVSL